MINPEIEDPNNHVPEVTPDDDWGDLEPHQEAQLPPRRQEPQKSLKSELVISGYKRVEPERSVDAMSAMGFGQARSDDAQTVGSEIPLGKELRDFESAGVQLSANIPANAVENRVAAAEFKEWASPPKKISVRWMVGVPIGVIGLVAVSILLTHFTGRDDKDKIAKARPEMKEESKVTGETDETMLRLNSGAELAREMYAKYATADRIEDFIDVIYLRDRNVADLTRVWKPLAAPDDWKTPEKSTWSAQSNGDKPYGSLSGVNHDFSRFNAIFRYENGELKLDWKASVGYGSAGFEDLKIGKGDASEIRGSISLSNFYTSTLPENRYRCFLFTSPKKDASVWVYTEIDSQIDQQILSMFMASPITGEYLTEAMVTLSLERGEQEILPRQWMVSKLISMNWLDQNTP